MIYRTFCLFRQLVTQSREQINNNYIEYLNQVSIVCRKWNGRGGGGASEAATRKEGGGGGGERGGGGGGGGATEAAT